jgi:hypothetical protein
MNAAELVAAAARIVRTHRSVSAFLISTTPQWSRLGRMLPDPPRADMYDRHTLGRMDDVEVVIIKWGVRSATPAHGHPEGGCWLAVLEGSLMEELPHMRSSDYLTIGFRSGATDVHVIRSVGEVPAMSVHIYDHRSGDSSKK